MIPRILLKAALLLFLLPGISIATEPAASTLQATLARIAPRGIEILNIATIHGEARVLGTAHSRAEIDAFIARLRSSGLMPDAALTGLQSPREGPHVFFVGGRGVAPLEMVAAKP